MNNQLEFYFDGEESRALDDVLSLERIRRYLEAAEGDRALAYRLYAHNTAVSESLYSALQMLEIALRNRFHVTLSALHGWEWYDRLGVINDVYQRNQLKEAKQSLIQENKPMEPSRIVASLSFGFWTSCLGKNYEELWRQCLRRAFARAPAGLTRKKLNTPLIQIRLLRNRIAHHEPILRYNLPDRHARIIELTGWLSFEASEWARMQSRFDDVYDPDLAALFRD